MKKDNIKSYGDNLVGSYIKVIYGNEIDEALLKAIYRGNLVEPLIKEYGVAAVESHIKAIKNAEIKDKNFKFVNSEMLLDTISISFSSNNKTLS